MCQTDIANSANFRKLFWRNPAWRSWCARGVFIFLILCIRLQMQRSNWSKVTGANRQIMIKTIEIRHKHLYIKLKSFDRPALLLPHMKMLLSLD